MSVELLPGSRDDLSLYAYSGGGGKLPPDVSSVVACEASHNAGGGKTEKKIGRAHV